MNEVNPWIEAAGKFAVTFAKSLNPPDAHRSPGDQIGL